MPVGEKKVGLPELFYDLVFVYALFRTTELEHHADEADYATFLISLVILFTVWLYQSIYINRFGDNSWRDRLFLFADMFLLLFLSNAVGSDWLANFVPFNLALGLLVGNVCLQYLLQLARHASPEQRRRIKLVAGLRGLTTATVLGSLLFPANIGQWVALGGFGLGWILPAFVRHKQPAVNFPHLLERLNGLVIIFFGETVIDIASYFHVAKFEIGALPVIVILFAMFTVYVMQFSYFIDEHKAQNSGALPSYSHYAVLIGIALTTGHWRGCTKTASLPLSPSECCGSVWACFISGLPPTRRTTSPNTADRNGFGFFRRPYSLSAQGWPPFYRRSPLLS